MPRDGAILCVSQLPSRGRGFPLSSATLAHRMGEGLGVRAMGVERAGVRGKPTIPPLSAFPLLRARENGPKGRMASSHSLFQASGLAGGR